MGLRLLYVGSSWPQDAKMAQNGPTWTQNNLLMASSSTFLAPCLLVQFSKNDEKTAGKTTAIECFGPFDKLKCDSILAQIWISLGLFGHVCFKKPQDSLKIASSWLT